MKIDELEEWWEANHKRLKMKMTSVPYSDQILLDLHDNLGLLRVYCANRRDALGEACERCCKK